MTDSMEYIVSAVGVGTVATAVMDLWGFGVAWLRGVPPPNYGQVGRWIGYMALGRFRHASIAAAAPLPRERLIGWTAHYLIGMAFAALLLAIWGLDWVRRPTPGPALIVGIGTVVAPFLLMHPGMGLGIAAGRTPRPAAARIRSLVAHGIFGVGLFAGGWVMSLLTR